MVWDMLDYRFFPWIPAQSFGGQKHLLASAGVLGTTGWNVIFYVALTVLHMHWSPKIQKRWAIWSGLWVLILMGGMLCGHFQIKAMKEKYSVKQPVALLQGA